MDGDRYEANGITEHPISITNPLRFATQTKTQSCVLGKKKSIVFTTNNDKNPLSPVCLLIITAPRRSPCLAVCVVRWGWGVCVSRHKIPVQTKWILVSNQRARTHTQSTQHKTRRTLHCRCLYRCRLQKWNVPFHPQTYINASTEPKPEVTKTKCKFN